MKQPMGPTFKTIVIPRAKVWPRDPRLVAIARSLRMQPWLNCSWQDPKQDPWAAEHSLHPQGPGRRHMYCT